MDPSLDPNTDPWVITRGYPADGHPEQNRQFSAWGESGRRLMENFKTGALNRSAT
jgi:hypothetical protein